MSTRSTLAYVEVIIPAVEAWESRWHLYEEAVEDGYVYLEKPDGETIAIPRAVWNELRKAEAK